MYEIILQLPFNGFQVKSTLSLPTNAKSLIIFSHGKDGGHIVPTEEEIAKHLHKEGYATLRYDFLHEYERGYKIDIDILSRGLVSSTLWLHDHSEYRSLNIGYLGIGTGAAAAIKATVKLKSIVTSLITISGRVDLAENELIHLKCPVLLIAAELDFQGLKINEKALKKINGLKQLAIVPGASRLFDESGKVGEVKNIILDWSHKHLPAAVKDKWLQHYS